MKEKPTWINTIELTEPAIKSTGKFVQIDGEEFYLIQNYDQMRPFFMSLVSHSDHWLFISTTGGLSAGEKDAEFALFPYYTDDKIRDDAEITGSKTIFRIRENDKTQLWEPFSIRYDNGFKKQRNLYKSRTGNKVIFEEVNQDLGLTYQYSWSFSERYGFVKSSKLTNTRNEHLDIEVLDGLQNILPSGVMSTLQSNASNLVNAYKKNELDQESGLGLFMLSAMIVDKAEPSEALKTTSVWSIGLKRNRILLSSLQLNDFRCGREIKHETDIRAERGAYFINNTITLEVGKSKDWSIVAEVNQDHGKVVDLIQQLKNEGQLNQDLSNDLTTAKEKLLKLVGKADGLQLTADKLSVGRHYSNVLFNIMRGGIFDEDYKVEKADFLDYVNTINHQLIEKIAVFFNDLEEKTCYYKLLNSAKRSGDHDLIRICYEYLPLTFSRRHGDPSRPWNKFNIATKDERGNKLRQYEGNWRDIFQNWEALAVSYPGFILSMITKFVNASTIDGYNPYRITREGFDWETIEPNDPWSYIGYWGDHQIIYLQKLLEIAMSHQEDELLELLSTPQFVYANVPYRIKRYHEILQNPRDTIRYDQRIETMVEERVAEIGSDGKLVFSGGEILRANLTEKLLVSFLAKMSNYIPEGGIWLNTQRPEWNDANNALVGNGISMVTLCYMRRFASSMMELFTKANAEFTINNSIASLFNGILEVLESSRNLLEGSISNKDRKNIADKLGKLGESYRSVAYKGFISDAVQISSSELHLFFKRTLEHIDHAIKANKRADGLYHAYNLLSFKGDEAIIDNLYEMLEGQVAVLSSGLLSLEESLAGLDALKASDIYREDQYSYMLYPNRILPRFLEKNDIPSDFIRSSKLAQELLQVGDRSLLYTDIKGSYHFNGSFNNVESLKNSLDKLKETAHGYLVEEEYDQYLEVFEEMFKHKAFTGRSGTFYGYEGLGSIYWHMVSKLSVAVQENIYWHWSAYQGTAEMGRMIDHYYEIRAGIGINKSPELYGSIPTEPYSHTPGGKGVQQPGMTGQVKEDILNRWAELGVYVLDNKIHFDPIFLDSKEYLTKPNQFDYLNLEGNKISLKLNAGQLAFTYCQVPIIYEKGKDKNIEVALTNGKYEVLEGNILKKEFSKEVFNRSGGIEKIKVIQRLK